MNQTRNFEIAILGGGPTALVAALTASKFASTALVLRDLPGEAGRIRIDAIPAQTLALLVELGINPGALGVDRLHHQRCESWVTASPQWSPSRPTAHVERPLLEQALFDVVRSTGRISIIIDGTRPQFDGRFSGIGWQAKELIDATGRTSVTSQERTRSPHSWASRYFWTPRRAARATPELRIAALPNGYAYRLGSARRIGIGLVGRGHVLKADSSELETMLRDQDAEWLIEGMPPLSSMISGASGVSSVQWAKAGRAVLAGDASFARDALSSQGLAGSMSDALYAVAAVRSGNREAPRKRQIANLAIHLMHLRELLMRCRLRTVSVWNDYEQFIRTATESLALDSTYPPLWQGVLTR